MDAKTETERAKSLVLGATGLVGGFIADHLVRNGARPLALSRSPQSRPGIEWFCGDLAKPDAKVSAFCDPLLHRQRHPFASGAVLSVQPVIEAGRHFQFDQRHYQTG
jgi:uncharacterized protein YbjT (DUF2867 family)